MCADDAQVYRLAQQKENLGKEFLKIIKTDTRFTVRTANSPSGTSCPKLIDIAVEISDTLRGDLI